jgi:FkbM family methyltransferase
LLSSPLGRVNIIDCLRIMGFQHVILATDIYEYHLPHASEEIAGKGFDYYLDHKKDILECFDLLADDLSREIYAQFLQTHMQRRPCRISSHPLAEQYFPKDIVLGKGCSRYIGCGAYDGDTVMQLNTLHGKVEAVACFEPDPRNFGLLVKYLCKAHKDVAGNVVAFPCGVFSHACQLHFESGNDFNSMISEQGESFIQCVALDDVLPGFGPTYITMDVEGAEMKALLGAERLIAESRPDLAICVYHSPNHIWDVPLYLKRVQSGYTFYLRNYTSFASETVLYATT